MLEKLKTEKYNSLILDKKSLDQYRLNSSNFSNFLTTKTKADWAIALSAFFVAMLQSCKVATHFLRRRFKIAHENK